MDASKKSPAVEQFLTNMFGEDRVATINSNKCVKEPFGCGGDADMFEDDLSRKEYSISGLCQKCQNEIFGTDMSDDRDRFDEAGLDPEVATAYYGYTG